MPSNLFVVIFPRKVQAHTVFVTRREKPKSKWIVGGLRSPQGVVLPSASSPGSDGSSEERPADGANGVAAAGNFNEAKNQKTVRVQLSRPTEELFPDLRKNRKAAAATATYVSAAGATRGTSAKINGASWHPPSRSKLVGAETSGSGAGNDAISRRLGSSAPGVGVGTGSATQHKKKRRESFQNQHLNVTSNVEGSIFETTGSGSGSSERTRSCSCSRESSSATAARPPGAVSAGREGDRGAMSALCHQEQYQQAGDGWEVAKRPGASAIEMTPSEANEIGADEESKEAEEPEGSPEETDGNHPLHGTASTAAKELNMPEVTSTPGSKRRLVTEVIGDDDVDVSRPQDMDGGEKVDIEAHVREVLWEMRKDQLLIGEPTFHTSATGKLMTCIFPCDVEDAHLVLTKLESVGVGSECGSVNVLPMEIGRSDITRRRQRETSTTSERDEDHARRQRHSRMTGGKHGDGSTQTGEVERDEEDARRANVQFRALASQIRVTQVTEEIRQGTKCHFDYMALLVASSAISAMGLATDNVAVVVAAMLVSPIMGPVLAFTFGTNVRDWSLAKKGFLVETLSLCVCVAVGFVVGIFGVFFLDEETWPTHEMETRGNPWGLLTGIAIAIPSGMAVALSILSKNVNSLVGVAISASLLPPAVNTGLCLSMALVGPAVVNFHVDAMDYVKIGLISMSLTIVNILSIYVAGVWLFIFKEVAPIKSENSFWSKDMIYARKFQQKLSRAGAEGGEAALNLRKSLLEAATLQGERNSSGGICGEQGASSSAAACRYADRMSSFSPPTTTHHLYWHKDRRRRPTVFDLFPNDLDTGVPEVEDVAAANRESERPESGGGLVMGLMAKFLDSSKREDISGGNEERWKNFQNLLSGGTSGGTFRGGGSLRSLRGGTGGASGGGGGGGGSGGSLRVSSSMLRGERWAANVGAGREKEPCS